MSITQTSNWLTIEAVDSPNPIACYSLERKQHTVDDATPRLCSLAIHWLLLGQSLILPCLHLNSKRWQFSLLQPPQILVDVLAVVAYCGIRIFLWVVVSMQVVLATDTLALNIRQHFSKWGLNLVPFLSPSFLLCCSLTRHLPMQVWISLALPASVWLLLLKKFSNLWGYFFEYMVSNR